MNKIILIIALMVGCILNYANAVGDTLFLHLFNSFQKSFISFAAFTYSYGFLTLSRSSKFSIVLSSLTILLDRHVF